VWRVFRWRRRLPLWTCACCLKTRGWWQGLLDIALYVVDTHPEPSFLDSNQSYDVASMSARLITHHVIQTHCKPSFLEMTGII